jgi:hypothetical protein
MIDLTADSGGEEGAEAVGGFALAELEKKGRSKYDRMAEGAKKEMLDK